MIEIVGHPMLIITQYERAAEERYKEWLRLTAEERAFIITPFQLFTGTRRKCITLSPHTFRVELSVRTDINDAF